MSKNLKEEREWAMQRSGLGVQQVHGPEAGLCWVVCGAARRPVKLSLNKQEGWTEVRVARQLGPDHAGSCRLRERLVFALRETGALQGSAQKRERT